jgi:membrane associated rhomboid family serine protease
MANKATYSFFSKIFLIIIGIIYFINFIYSNVLPDFLSLSPNDVIKNLSLWKLISFPFAPNGIESVVFFAFVFYFISSKLETYIEGLRYPLWLFLLTLLQGCILTLVFINSNVVIAGMDGISFYVLVVYSLLRSKDKINFLNFPPLPILAFSMLIGFLWFGLKLVNFSTTGNESQILSAIGSSLFGITAGLIHYLQIRLSGMNNI